MSLLLPLGLLGLVSLLVLLLIYILKPNYQQKSVSSTFVWKLSLKYKKKRLPISKLRNLLIILCQIFVLALASLIIAEPNLVTDADTMPDEAVIIVDGSASMLLSYEGSTRFDRAKSRAKDIAAETFDGNGVVSVIFAGREANIVVQRASSSERETIARRVDALECSYGNADMDGAMTVAADILNENANAQIYIVTGTNYIAPGSNVTISDISVEGEWNAAILDVRTELVNGFYNISVDVACYGKDEELFLNTHITSANGVPGVTDLQPVSVQCYNNEVFTVVYTAETHGLGPNTVPVVLTDDMRIYSFDRIYFHVDEADGYVYDNEYYLYGGNKPTVKIQYSSDAPSNFFGGFLLQLTETVSDRWTVEVDEVSNGKPATEGYDFYIFENDMPNELPEDGVVFMVNPDSALDAGFTIVRRVSIGNGNWNNPDGSALAQGADHPILKYVDATAMHVSEYLYINEDSIDSEYETLLYYEGNPVFIVKNEPTRKIAVLALSLKMSNLALCWGFPVMLTNLFEFYFPATFERNVFDIYTPVTLNARGETVSISDADNNVSEIAELPAAYTASAPGTYTVSQELMSGEVLSEQFYVRINSAQSNIFRDEADLEKIIVTQKPQRTFQDLMVYFAAATVVLLFVEWLLQMRGNSV